MTELLLHSRTPDPEDSGLALKVESEQAGWDLLGFSARSLRAGREWIDGTGEREACLVLQSGACRIRWDGSRERLLGPRASVFSSYPHAAYLPPGVRFQVTALEDCEIAAGTAVCRKSFEPRVIAPEDCGFEIRGGGNATRQIVDIMPPEFPADRLMVCEVYTPSGNWSSYPPHKHEVDDPPYEAKLEEVYYYRFPDREAYGFQRIYSSDGSLDETLRVEDRDLVLIPRGYHPFVTAYGYDAYYLNFLAGDRRSMAASDDPRYARFRTNWPPADPRMPVIPRPRAEVATQG